jgi:hypothetical protein
VITVTKYSPHLLAQGEGVEHVMRKETSER